MPSVLECEYSTVEAFLEDVIFTSPYCWGDTQNQMSKGHIFTMSSTPQKNSVFSGQQMDSVPSPHRFPYSLAEIYLKLT